MSINNLLQQSYKELDGYHNSRNTKNRDANEKAIIHYNWLWCEILEI
jgi:hypothetical protein